MKVSVVVSIYNEECVLPLFCEELLPVLSPFDYELIFVNDGSTDSTQKIIDAECIRNKRIKSIQLSRNFGHEAAMIAGIDYASGDAVICMDGDLQHPPASIPEMLACFERNATDVITMVRSNVKKKFFSRSFYKLINAVSDYRIDPNASDFFLISRRIADILRTNFRERVRFLRGFIQIIGFRKESLNYVALDRRAGKSKYPIRRLISLSVVAIASLSKSPLKISLGVSFLSGSFSLLLVVYSIIMKIVQKPVSGYTTIIVFLGIMFSILFFVLGILGEYIGFLFDEQKGRPIYLVDKTSNL